MAFEKSSDAAVVRKTVVVDTYDCISIYYPDDGIDDGRHVGERCASTEEVNANRTMQHSIFKKVCTVDTCKKKVGTHPLLFTGQGKLEDRLSFYQQPSSLSSALATLVNRIL